MMVTLRPDWQQRLTQWHSDDAELERAEFRAAELPVTTTDKGGRPRKVLPAKRAAKVLHDLGRFSYRYTAKKHDLSYSWLRDAYQEGRLEAMADGHYR